MSWILLLALVSVYPTDLDPATKAFLEAEVSQILAVTERPHTDIFVRVDPSVTNFGEATPDGKMGLHPFLVESAKAGKGWTPWVLRVTVAHELAHIMAGHRRTRFITPDESQRIELEADRMGIEYFRRLRWPCEPWVKFMSSFLKTKNTNAKPENAIDRKARLELAKRLCGE